MSRDIPPVNADELTHRVAILRRFRELLIRQRERFQQYLLTLDQQQMVIESGSAEAILSHVELEEQIVNDIFSIQKVIDPLETLYRNTHSAAHTDDIPALKAALDDLKNQAGSRAAHNRDLLSARMADIRGEITHLRNNPFAGAARSLYHNPGAASLIDIEG